MATSTQPEHAVVPPPSRIALLLHGLSVAVLSAYPLSLILHANLGMVPIGASTLLWGLAVHFLLAGGLFVALRLLTSDVAGRAVWLGVFFLVFGGYFAVLRLTAALGWPLLPERPSVAIGYCAAGAVLATIIVKPWKVRRRDPVLLLIIGVVLVGTNAISGISRAVTSSAVGGKSWHAAAATLTQSALSDGGAPSASPERDIFYIVADGFGHAETLERLYDVDLTDFVQFLAGKGFYVAPKAQTNYGQTYLSLAATLNLGYLDEIASVMGRANTDRTPLAHLIDHNALMALAKRAGYRVVGIGSDYIATERIISADVCECRQYGSSSAEQAVFASTPLVAMALGPKAFNAHRRKVDSAFQLLEQMRSSTSRLFVFAHVLAPHPPFVFQADGSPPGSFGLFMFQDGSHYQGSREDYRQGYGGQTRYVVGRLKAVVQSLLSRPGPSPVIVIHGDHGPGMDLDWGSAERTDMSERMGIFAAYYFPEAREQPYPTITPINGARLLSNGYLGTNLPRLEDKSFYSTWEKPYDFVQTGN